MYSETKQIWAVIISYHVYKMIYHIRSMASVNYSQMGHPFFQAAHSSLQLASARKMIRLQKYRNTVNERNKINTIVIDSYLWDSIKSDILSLKSVFPFLKKCKGREIYLLVFLFELAR